MQSAPIPENEKERLISLHKSGLLDTKPEERFDRITRTATEFFKVPISTLTLVDTKREWFKSCRGLSAREGDRAISFCGHALLAEDLLVIPDTKKDKRFADNPMVIGKPFIRFYAGVPIINADGERIGVFCIKDTKPRKFSKANEEMLKNLAAWAELEVNSHNLSLVLSEDRKMRVKLKVQMREIDNAKIAASNVLQDLEIEKSKVEIDMAKDEAILESLGEGLIAVDTDRKVILVNKVAINMLGLEKRENIMGKVITELRLEDEAGHLVPLAKRPTTIALTTNAISKVVYFFVRKNKTRFPMAITATPIVFNGKTIGLIEIIRDVSKENEIDKAKSEFVSLASHQLRTPLTAISWYTEMILGGKVGDILPKQKKYLEEIYHSNKRMISLVNTLLNVSRIETGTFTIEPKPINIITLAQSVLDEQKHKIEEKQIKIIRKLDKTIPIFSADSNLLRMVLQNLLANAVKYTGDGGTVMIEITLSNVENILIKISDTGYGIPYNQQDKIFTKFFRADNVTEKDTDGTGLGLYIVKSIIEKDGGKIWFDSPSVDKAIESDSKNPGTTFYVEFPKDGMTKNKV